MNIELPRKRLDLSSAIAEGDIRVLLMVLVHMTGDKRWLEPPYQPMRDVRLIPDPEAGLPKEIQDEIRAADARGNGIHSARRALDKATRSRATGAAARPDRRCRCLRHRARRRA